ncbi:unnamed protein product, partial [Ectocarpus fasciculatus]
NCFASKSVCFRCSSCRSCCLVPRGRCLVVRSCLVSLRPVLFWWSVCGPTSRKVEASCELTQVWRRDRKHGALSSTRNYVRGCARPQLFSTLVSKAMVNRNFPPM